MPAHRRAFREDVQGLRAVAVAGVVVYHLWPDRLPGGFVGVDVFFVISGYLITGQIVAEMRRTGRLSLRQFWARRIRRILPAALTVLGACVAILLTLMPRLTWQENLAEIRAAAAYYENWLLGARAVDYLAADGSPSLVQHYWSLSVEEQFYLAWPLLLLLALGLAALAKRVPLRLWATLVLAGAAVASFVVSLRWTASTPAMAFFATPVRAWEFAAGGLVAVAVPRWTGGRAATARVIGGWCGIGLIAYAYAVLSSRTAFPGWAALLPVGGASLVIAAETPHRRWSSAPLLGTWPVRRLGDVSYSLYLWHWPLIVAAPWVLHGPVTARAKLALLASSLILAGLTTLLVEDPARAGRWWRARTVPAYAFAVTGVATLALLCSSVATGARHHERQVVAKTQARIQQQTETLVVTRHRSCFGAAAMLAVNRCAQPYARPRRLDPEFAATDGIADPCLQDYDASTPDMCVLGATKDPVRTVAIVGNSHAWRLVPALDLYGRHHRWRIVVATRVNCLGLVTEPIGSAGASPHCLSWSAAAQQRLLAMPHLDAVVFGGYRFADEFVEGGHAPAEDVRAARQRILATWSRFAARGIRVVVTGDVPGMRPVADPECLAESADRYDPCARARRSVVKPNLMATVALAHPRTVDYVPLARYFCDDRRCHALVGGVVVYFDSHHLTRTYSRSLARYLGADIAAALDGPDDGPVSEAAAGAAAQPGPPS